MIPRFTIPARRGLPLVAAVLATLAPLVTPRPAPAEETSIEDLEDRIEILTEEVRRMKEAIVLPETDAELESYGGLGPAASKVYSKTSGLSLGGYGEYHFETPTGPAESVQTADMLRFVTYIGYKFRSDLLMNAEIEYEHGTTSSNWAGKAGSVSVEFAYLDFLIANPINVRGGSLLIPMGFLNQLHEPPFYRGNVRPSVETRIIPTTWRELGVGLYGSITPELGYHVYLINGFNAKKYSSTGVRGGRQKGNRVLYEDAGVVLAASYQPSPKLLLAASVFAGGAGQKQTFAGEQPRVLTRIAEAHLEFRHRGFQGRALIAGSSIGDAGIVSEDLSDPPDDLVVIPERQLGWYLEASYDVAPHIGLPSRQSLLPWLRYEDVDLNQRVPPGYSAAESLSGQSLVLGLEWKPVYSVVVKGDVTIQQVGDGVDTPNPLRIGAGFIF